MLVALEEKRMRAEEHHGRSLKVKTLRAWREITRVNAERDG